MTNHCRKKRPPIILMKENDRRAFLKELKIMMLISCFPVYRSSRK
jgi:hypothetical protein